MTTKEQNLVDKKITCLETIEQLWTQIYVNGRPDWSHIIPFYHKDVIFRDTVQQINGIEEFEAMTQRLTARSKNLKMKLINTMFQGNIVFIEWEMTIGFKKYPDSIMYGCSRLTLTEEGKIIYQRDYYDLWGDIFDNIPRFGKIYRNFMHKKFG